MMAEPTDMESVDDNGSTRGSSSTLLTALKLITASALFYSAGTSFAETYHHVSNQSNNHVGVADLKPADMPAPSNHVYANSPSNGGATHGRRLSEISKKNPPSYMKELMEDLKARKKLMEETPPEEVKYWFEYTGPLQVSTFCFVQRVCYLYFIVWGFVFLLGRRRCTRS